MLEWIQRYIKEKMNPSEAFVQFRRIGKACSFRYGAGPDRFDIRYKLSARRLRNHVPAHKHQTQKIQRTYEQDQPEAQIAP